MEGIWDKQDRWLKWATTTKTLALVAAILIPLFAWLDYRELSSLLQPARQVEISEAQFSPHLCLRHCGGESSLGIYRDQVQVFFANCTGLAAVCGTGTPYSHQQTYTARNIRLIEMWPGRGVIQSMDVVASNGLETHVENLQAKDYATQFRERKQRWMVNSLLFTACLIAYALLAHFAAKRRKGTSFLS